MFPRSLFQSSFPVFCGRRDRGGIESLKRAVPAGSRAGEKASLRTQPQQLRKLPAGFIYMQSHTRRGALPGTQRFHMCFPADSCEKLTIGSEGKRPLRFTLPELDVQFVQCQEMSGLAVRERLEDAPPCSEILMPALLLHDTGALFKVCRFMEVGGWGCASPDQEDESPSLHARKEPQ